VKTANRSKGKGSTQRDPLPPNNLNTWRTQKTQTRASDDKQGTE